MNTPNTPLDTDDSGCYSTAMSELATKKPTDFDNYAQGDLDILAKLEANQKDGDSKSSSFNGDGSEIQE